MASTICTMCNHNTHKPRVVGDGHPLCASCHKGGLIVEGSESALGEKTNALAAMKHTLPLSERANPRDPYTRASDGKHNDPKIQLANENVARRDSLFNDRRV